MSGQTVTIKVADFAYTLTCPPGQEQKILDLADELNRRIANEVPPHVEQCAAFLILALVLADELKSKPQPTQQTEQVAPPQAFDESELLELISKIDDKINNLEESIQNLTA